LLRHPPIIAPIGVQRQALLTERLPQEEEKAKTYEWYNLPLPSNNSGENQTCELDHLISLELGGADTLANIWPQCGPSGVALPQRFFKEKDTVENFLAMQVREGQMDLSEAQKGIATDWPSSSIQRDERAQREGAFSPGQHMHEMIVVPRSKCEDRVDLTARPLLT
jgi:hypothetical protein